MGGEVQTGRYCSVDPDCGASYALGALCLMPCAPYAILAQLIQIALIFFEIIAREAAYLPMVCPYVGTEIHTITMQGTKTRQVTWRH